MKVIVLAAGFATRLYPLTLHQAKPLLDIAGKPMLTRLLERVLELKGISEIYVVSNERFFSQFEDWAKTFSAPVPIHLLNDGTSTDETKLGAIGDMAFAMDQWMEEEEMMVVAGDNLIEFDLVACHDEFKRQRRSMILVREIDDMVAMKRYNEVVVANDGLVKEFREKPKKPSSNLAAIALYFFLPQVREKLHQYLTSGGNPDAPGYFIEWLVKQMPVTAKKFEGRWFDIGNLETLEQAREEYAAK